MKRKLFFPLFLLAFFFSALLHSQEPPWRGKVVRYEKAASLNSAQLQATMTKLRMPQGLKPSYGVDFYRVIYKTPNLEGKESEASGMLVLPQGAKGPLPFLSYQHGTTVERKAVPSSPHNSEMLKVAGIFAGSGYVVGFADYLGLGDSPGFHPYLHAATEASASLDMVRAGKKILEDLKAPLSGKIFLAGYSQGGHSTMALHREIQTNHPKEFPLTAVAPMAGPYDLSGTSFPMGLKSPSKNSSVYAAYVLLAYDWIYDIYPQLSDAVENPYAQWIPALFNGKHTFAQVSAKLNVPPAKMVKPSFIQSALTRPNDPFMQALKKNDVYDWKPEAPVRLYYVKADRDVPYQNALVASGRMNQLGASVEAVNLGDTLDHDSGFLPSLLAAKKWMDGFLK